MTKVPISVCVISGAEVSRLPRALRSISEWTMESIVVLNQDVKDGTAEAAEACGARVYREPWRGFIGQKNAAADKAACEWILGLDADEEVSPRLRDEILALFQGSPATGPHAAFNFPRCTFYQGRWIRHGDWYPDRTTRLWRKSDARWGGLDPHAVLEVKGSIGKLKGDLLHYLGEPYNRQVEKMLRYSDDFVSQCARQNRSVSLADLVLRPWWRFLRCYLFRLGVLDGRQGYNIAWMGAFYTYLRYAKALEAQRNSSVQK